ncbi:PREDICTED: pyrin-like, partial [Eurypyga helias]|uniref:pyrin-like n=1 Tax=Eurypyga helias TaxID=54383 RepID=UPI0005282FC3
MTVEANTTGAQESMREKDLQEVSQQIQTLQKAFQNMQEFTQRELQSLRVDVEGRLGWTVEEDTTGFLESMWKNDLQEVFQQIQTLQKALQNRQESTQRELQILRADVEGILELFKIQRYKGKHKGDDGVDVTLDADTAHPRLEISDDGKSVKDTGAIRHVPSNEKRFDSHTFVLAKEGYASGRHYWQVDVGKRSSWVLGIAQESVTRKGMLTLSPENGFWVIGFADGRECWAHTHPRIRLSVSGKVHRIGIFLDISAEKLTFYNIHKKAALYAFTIAAGSIQEGKFLPFFSTGPVTANPDTEPLKIVQGFDHE